MTGAARIWWSASELAEAGLPDVPTTPQGVRALARRLGWALDPVRARTRAGQGGGLEFHRDLLPGAARRALARLEAAERPAEVPPARAPRAQVWAEWERVPEDVRVRARERVAMLDAVAALEDAGIARVSALDEVAALNGVSAATLRRWLRLVEGVRGDDRVAYLVPRHQLATRPGPRVACHPEVWEFLKADFLRLSAPAFSACYRRAQKIARDEGVVLPPENTLRRRMDAEVPEAVQVLARSGVEAAKRKFPPMVRDKTCLHAMEAVNADFHKFDVFVRWPGPRGDLDATVIRPQMVAFQDIHSGRILSWRLAETPNKVTTALAFGDMVEAFGIPDHVTLDNGREFAAKFLTGGAPTRYRFKVLADEPLGIFTQMGVQVHFATPYAGQSKPIERAFRDMCEDIARHPAFEGAWTGNRPDAKPENYGNVAIPLDEFTRIVSEGIVEHNARSGRRSVVAAGGSLLAAFEASYAQAPIRLATPEQRRLWLLGAEGVRAQAEHGRVMFQGNAYWAGWMVEIAGEKVVIRFDPAALQEPLHIYSHDGRYLGEAPCVEAVGFYDLDGARAHARARNAQLRAEREALAALRSRTAIELTQRLRSIGAPGEPAPSSRGTVVRGVFGAGRGAAAVAAPEPDFDRDDIEERRLRGIHLLYPAQDSDAV